MGVGLLFMRAAKYKFEEDKELLVNTLNEELKLIGEYVYKHGLLKKGIQRKNKKQK